jgi:hypothetical protein
MYLARLSFRSYLLKLSKEYSKMKKAIQYKINYLLILLILPPPIYLIACKIKEYKYYKKYPQDKKRTRYELF